MNRKHSLFLSCAVGATLLGAALATPAAAQQAPGARQESTSVEEVIVTATRRETNLQTTPVAVSVVSPQVIEQAAPRDLGDLAVFVPNFSAARITGFNAASFAMRGVGQNNIIVYYEPPVAVLVDDFVVPSVQTQLLDTFDISQVEVLRGPQGTLFGRNTTGGAVVVHTKRPNLDSYQVQGQAMLGSFGTRDAKLAVDMPIVQGKLGLRLVGSYENSDGYMKNGACYGPITPFVPSKFAGAQGCGDGSSVGGTNAFSGRAKLLWKPDDRLSVLAQYEIVRDHSDTPATVNETPPGPNFVFNLIGVGAPSGDPIDNAGVTNRHGFLIDEQKGHRVDVDGVYLNVDYVADAGTLTSVTGYRSQRSNLPSTYTGLAPVAPDGDVLSLFDANRTDDRKTFQQELRFASSFNGPFNFVAGGFYQHDKTDFCVAQLLGFLDLLSGPLPFGPWNENPYILCNNQKAENLAGFAEANYKVTDKLILTGGIRYTHEKKIWQGRQQVFSQQLGGGFDPTFTYQQLGNLLDAGDFDRFPAGVVTSEGSWNEPTYRASISYQATPDIFTYATYSRGFKSGGYNDQIGSFAPFGSNLDAFKEAASPTNPEIANSYEAGIKTESFDHRLRLNLTGFWVDYSDMQKQIVVPIVVNGQPFQVTRFFNAAKAEVKGIEAEATLVPTDGLTIRGVLGYQDGKYKEYVTPIPAGYDLATAPLDRAPKWQWTVDATYTHPLGSWGELTLNGNVNYTGRNLFTQSITSPDENTYLEARTLVNASITVADASGRYYGRLVGRNLTDEHYRTASQVVGGLWAFTLYGPPRFVGVELGFKFGG